jgi:hypothetical protein
MHWPVIFKKYQDFIKTYWDVYSYKSYTKYYREWYRDDMIYEFSQSRYKKGIISEKIRDDMREEIIRDMYEHTEEWFDADDLDYIRSIQHIEFYTSEWGKTQEMSKEDLQLIAQAYG